MLVPLAVALATVPVTVLPVVPLAGVPTAETVLPTVVVTPETVEVTVLVAAFGVPVVAAVTCETVAVTAGTVALTAPVAPLTTPDNVEPSVPPGGLSVAAFAGPARSRPMPNATHSPPSAAPQVYKNTFRAS
jgi:hypothetical protein